MLGLRFRQIYTCTPPLNRLNRVVVPPGHGRSGSPHPPWSLKVGGRYERAPDTLFQITNESETSAMQDDGTQASIREEDEDDIDEPDETSGLDNMQLSEEVRHTCLVSICHSFPFLLALAKTLGFLWLAFLTNSSCVPVSILGFPCKLSSFLL